MANVTTVEPTSNLTTSSPSPALSQACDDQDLSDLLVLISSSMTIILTLYTLALYAQKGWIPRTVNTRIFIDVLVIGLAAAANLFAAVFFQHVIGASTRCQLFGFMEQVYSIGEPMLVSLFWCHTGWILFGLPQCSSTHREQTIVNVIRIGILLVSIASAFYAVFGEDSDGQRLIDFGNQKWCWFKPHLMWQRYALGYGWDGLVAVSTLFGIIFPLIRSPFLPKEHTLHFNIHNFKAFSRRMTIALAWVTVAVLQFLGRTLTTGSCDDHNKGGGVMVLIYMQAFFQPLQGFFDAATFLLSERLWTLDVCRKDASPPVGFAYALMDIQAKVKAEQFRDQWNGDRDGNVDYAGAGGDAGEALYLTTSSPSRGADDTATPPPSSGEGPPPRRHQSKAASATGGGSQGGGGYYAPTALERSEWAATTRASDAAACAAEDRTANQSRSFGYYPSDSMTAAAAGPDGRPRQASAGVPLARRHYGALEF